MKKKYIKIIVFLSALIILWFWVWKIIFSTPKVAIEYEWEYNIWFQEDKISENVYYIWYPTDDDKKTESVIASNVAFYWFSAIKNAQISKNKKFPVIFLFHGYEWNWKNQSWLAAQLARDGNIVIAQDIDGFSSIDYDIQSFLTIDNTLANLSNYINEIILDSDWSEYIDSERVYAWGTSLGGFIASVLWGSDYDFNAMATYCESHDGQECEFISPVLEKIKNITTEPSQKNSYISKTFLLAPWLMESVVINSSLEQFIVAAEYDENIDNETLKSFSGSNIKYAELDGVDHFTFLQACRPWAVEVLQKYDGAGKACLNSTSRQENHRNIFTQIQTFLAK